MGEHSVYITIAKRKTNPDGRRKITITGTVEGFLMTMNIKITITGTIEGFLLNRNNLRVSSDYEYKNHNNRPEQLKGFSDYEYKNHNNRNS